MTAFIEATASPPGHITPRTVAMSKSTGKSIVLGPTPNLTNTLLFVLLVLSFRFRGVVSVLSHPSHAFLLQIGHILFFQLR